MKILVKCGPPGRGKTRDILHRMLNVPGRYILSSPRTALLDEQATYLVAYAKTCGVSPHVNTIHSDQSCRGSVLRRAREALKTNTKACNATHVIVLITHETLMALDPADLADWHVRIDEVPDTSFTSGSMRVGASWGGLARHYALQPLEGTPWAQVTLQGDVEPLQRKQYGSDAAATLVGFHKAATSSSRNAFVDVAEWAEAGQSGREVRWWSLWSFGSLSACATVEMTGASFFSSLAYHALLKFEDTIEIVQCDVPIQRVRADRHVNVHYYASHSGSTMWWKTDDGSRCLVEISRHLERIGFDGFWTANDDALPYFRHRFSGTLCRPKLAGTNSLRQYESCAMIYSAKAVSGDHAAIKVLGIDPTSIKAAREDEDIFQFVLRGALRDPEWAGTFDVHIYSEDQAHALARRLREAGISPSISIIPVAEAGIMNVLRPPALQSKVVTIGADLTPNASVELRKTKERARGKRRRREARERAVTEGTLRGRGRPRKANELAKEIAARSPPDSA